MQSTPKLTVNYGRLPCSVLCSYEEYSKVSCVVGYGAVPWTKWPTYEEGPYTNLKKTQNIFLSEQNKAFINNTLNLSIEITLYG